MASSSSSRHKANDSLIFGSELYLELDLPLTTVTHLQSIVPLPSVDIPPHSEDNAGKQASYNQAHYVSQLALRRLCARLHGTIDHCSSSTLSVTNRSSHSLLR